MDGDCIVVLFLTPGDAIFDFDSVEEGGGIFSDVDVLTPESGLLSVTGFTSVTTPVFLFL